MWISELSIWFIIKSYPQALWITFNSLLGLKHAIHTLSTRYPQVIHRLSTGYPQVIHRENGLVGDHNFETGEDIAQLLVLLEPGLYRMARMQHRRMILAAKAHPDHRIRRRC